MGRVDQLPVEDILSLDELAAMRRARYRQTEVTHLRTEADALDFINDLGFVWLINLSDADLPSLHHAAPQPYEGEESRDAEKAESWWDSKQTLPGRKACYYSKVLRGRGTFISWECFPAFHAVYATGNDYEYDYRAGILSRDEKRVLDLIAACPGIPSPELRKRFGPIGKATTRALDRALQSLQETFRITVAGGSLEGWTIHNWALVEDWVPRRHLDEARKTDRSVAQEELALRYVRMAVAVTEGDIAWVFRWKRRATAEMVQRLVDEGRLHEVEVMEMPGVMFFME